MPELPDLEVIAEFLNRQLAGAQIEEASVLKPIVARDLTGDGFASRLGGQHVELVSRRGKFLLLRLALGDWLVIKPMRSGRLRYLAPGERAGGKPFVVLRFCEWREPALHRSRHHGQGLPDTRSGMRANVCRPRA